MTTELSTGLRFGLTDAEYRAIPAMSQSELKAFMRDPELYEHQYLLKDIPFAKPTEAMVLGCDVDSYVLSGELPDTLIIPSNVLTSDGKRAGNAWKQFEATYPGKRLLKQHECDRIIAQCKTIKDKIYDHPEAAALLAEGTAHPVLVWENDRGITCRAQLDWLTTKSNIIVDLKTATCNAPLAFTNQAHNLGYDAQAAWYSDGYRAVTGKDPRFIFLVVEVTTDGKPTANRVECFEPSERFIANGRRKIEIALDDWLECQRTKVWRSKTWGQIVYLEPPAWAAKQLEEWNYGD